MSRREDMGIKEIDRKLVGATAWFGEGFKYHRSDPPRLRLSERQCVQGKHQGEESIMLPQILWLVILTPA